LSKEKDGYEFPSSASGYVGGELARLPYFRPRCRAGAGHLERLASKPFTSTHPNLRSQTALNLCR
jgi:N-acetyl-gamma-glutamylphosphate reductase